MHNEHAVRSVIEHDRYANIERDVRFCKLCNLREIGDEFHYLLKCPLFKVDQRRYLKKYFYENTNTIKFHQLMNSSGKTLIKLANLTRKV